MSFQAKTCDGGAVIVQPQIKLKDVISRQKVWKKAVGYRHAQQHDKSRCYRQLDWMTSSLVSHGIMSVLCWSGWTSTALSAARPARAPAGVRGAEGAGGRLSGGRNLSSIPGSCYLHENKLSVRRQSSGRRAEEHAEALLSLSLS